LPPSTESPDAESRAAPTRQPDFTAALGVWAEEHAAFLQITLRRKSALNKTDENALWEIIADSWSADWGTARSRLGEAAQDLFERQKPENIPLGSIGLALDAGALGQSEERYRTALAHFTTINEELRQHAQLSRLLEILTAVDESQALTAATQKLNNRFKVAEKKPAREKPVKKGFRAYVDLLFGRRTAPVPAPETAEAAVAKTAPDTTPAARL